MFVGLLFFATVHEPGQVQGRLAWIADRLSLVTAPKIADELKSAVASISPSCGVSEGSECPVTSAAMPPRRPSPRRCKPPSLRAGSAPLKIPRRHHKRHRNLRSLETIGESASQPPVTSPWGFSIGGTNVSDQALEDVHAVVLKPNSGARALDLMLDVEGLSPGKLAVIPAGGRFSLVSESPNEDGATLGGAVLRSATSRPDNARPSILYLSPAMIARFANR